AGVRLRNLHRLLARDAESLERGVTGPLAGDEAPVAEQQVAVAGDLREQAVERPHGHARGIEPEHALRAGRACLGEAVGLEGERHVAVRRTVWRKRPPRLEPPVEADAS